MSTAKMLAAAALSLCTVLSGCMRDLGVVSFSPPSKPVWVGDGRHARLEAVGDWNFLTWCYNAEWRAGADTWSPEGALERCEAAHPTPLSLTKQSGSGETTVSSAEERTIICIEPLVVVVSPSTSHTWTFGPTRTTAPADPALEAAFDTYFARLIALPLAYRYGTEVWLVDGLAWFSPTLSPEPRPLVVDGQPTPIDLPSGSLVFEERNGKLEVGWQPRE